MIVFGIGSNLGDREQNLDKACEMLEAHMKSSKRSNIYEFDAMLKPESPAEWDIPFLNMAVGGLWKEKQSIVDILQVVESIEQKLGKKKQGVWAPRVIDVDIILCDQMVYDDGKLVIPHKSMLERDFVLKPLVDICPDWQHPITKQKISDLL